MKRHAWLTAAIVFVSMLVGCGLAGCDREPLPVDNAPQTGLRVNVHDVRQQQIVPTTVLTGELVPKRTVRINAEVDGAIVQRVLVDAGDRVERGQPLLQVDDTALRLELLQAQAESRQAATDAARLRVEFGRYARVAAAGGVSANDRDAKGSEFKAAQERTIAVAAMRDLAARRLDKARFVAPETGLVLTRNVEVGDRTGSSNEPYFVIAADGDVEFQAAVGVRQLDGLRPGLRATIRPADGSAQLSGSVRTAAIGVDARDRRGIVRIRLDATMTARSGVPATAFIVSPTRTALVVPADSVHFDPMPWVWAIERDKTVRRRELQLGASTDHGFEVLQGLRAGDTIVGDAGALLVAGESVVPVRADPAPAVTAESATAESRDPVR